MDFITGNRFKSFCNFIFDEEGFRCVNENKTNEFPKYFVKIDLVHVFFRNFLPKVNFILITHNGDLPVNDSCLNYLDNENLIFWYGQNVMVRHPKLKSIPIGIANENWTHGNTDSLQKVILKNNKKNNLIYANFDINTNLTERTLCMEQIQNQGIFLSQRKNFENYLEDLSNSYFSISPNGNGVDCHKIWESLYLNTIPIVTKSINVEFYKNLPILIIDSWLDFDKKLLTIDLYKKIWKKCSLTVQDFIPYLN
jgi:hypothetical protein